MTFFLCYMRGSDLVFAREVVADDFYKAQHRARQAMIRKGDATAADFASLRVRPTSVCEMPDGTRPSGIRKVTWQETAV